LDLDVNPISTEETVDLVFGESEEELLIAAIIDVEITWFG
jgi:hypothetical protein